MKNLAAYYRPQTFAQVAGQTLVTTVLSRAAAEDKVAPAYLLSGTRGVGKTTIARILAKALNCVNAPTGEPCNECEQCRKITQGNHVDVTEIDGASNNSVEDARALRENIGYAPMEGRYKVFIIDEAHMLSRSAFNALLKTLEEPPPRVVFVFATTEAHKFPITIVSRCQHFIFKRLPETELITHLTRVLEKEEMAFDPAAVRLLARRAAGSVRDGMSLLGQTLALGGESLTVEATRSVLGLAGQDMFFRLMGALHDADFASIAAILREILDQGADITYFLREFTALWRTLFLLQQSGNAIVPALDIPEDEAHEWQALAGKFTLGHIHAAWHMVLESQRKVTLSPEPAAALELLLFNIALLPRLLPLPHAGTPSVPPAGGGGTAPAGAGVPSASGTAESRGNGSTADAVSATKATDAAGAVSASGVSGQSEAADTTRLTSAPSLSAAGSGDVLSQGDAASCAAFTNAAPQALPTHPADSSTVPPATNDTATPRAGNSPNPAATLPEVGPAYAGAVPAQTHKPRLTAHQDSEHHRSSAGEEAPAARWRTAVQNIRKRPADTGSSAAPNAPAGNMSASAMPHAQPRAFSPAPHRGQEEAADDERPAPAGASSDAGADATDFWRDVCAHMGNQKLTILNDMALRAVRATQEDDRLLLATDLKSVYQKLVSVLPQISEAASKVAGHSVCAIMAHEEPQCRTEAQLVQEFVQRPEFSHCLDILDARVLTVRPK